MSKFPDISVIAPSVGDSQYSLGGLLFGQGQTWSVQKAEGLDLPKVRSKDAPRPLDSGEFEGLDFLSGRDITITFHSQFASDTAKRAGLLALGSLFIPPQDGVTESWLYFQRPGNPLFVVGVRPRKFALKSEMKLTSIGTAQPIGLLHATSAYVYGPTQSLTQPVGGVAAGFSFPFSFNLSFGGGGSIGIFDIDNTGVVPARPVYVFQGPIKTPTVTNSATGQFFSLSMNLVSGDQLVVDTDLDGPSCVYYPAGSNTGYSVLTNLVAGSVPLLLPVGNSKLVFTSLDSAPTSGSCEVMWAPSYPIAI